MADHTLRAVIKGILKVCLIALAIVILAAILLFAGFPYLVEKDNRTLHDRDYYRKSLEFRINDTLPSCKFIKQEYWVDHYARAVIQLSESDYQKVLTAAKSDSTFRVITDSNWPQGYEETIKLMKKVRIAPQDVTFKYKIYSTKLGFVPPDKIIYDRDLR